jgi:hypothetical protein
MIWSTYFIAKEPTAFKHKNVSEGWCLGLTYMIDINF